MLIISEIVDYLIIIMTSMGLAMDCLAVSISCGITQRGFNRRDAVVLAIFFGGFQGGMAFLGWLGGNSFAGYIEAVDHWVAFGLLSLIGGKMLWEGIHPKEECQGFNIRKLRVLLVLSIATSIDALAVGITYALLDTPIMIPVLAIGAVSLIFSVMGSTLGKKAGHLFGSKMEVLGGLILIGLGIKILLEHTVLA